MTSTEPHDSILANYQQELEDARKSGQLEVLNKLYNQFGTIYLSNKAYEQGMGMFKSAIQIAKDQADREMEARSIGAKGLALADTGRVEEAYKCFQSVLEIAEEINNREMAHVAVESFVPIPFIDDKIADWLAANVPDPDGKWHGLVGKVQ